jgi:hypothetical protein
MALTAKVRGQWRVVSKAMARVFRKRGVDVIDTAAPTVVLGAPVDAYTHLAALPGFTPGGRIDIDARGPATITINTATTPANERITVAAPFDLTDDELERLTAPDGKE